MKKMKRLFAVLLTLAMVLGMSMTTLAAPQNEDGIPRSSDTVDVKITGIKAGATVTLYKIVSAEYAENGIGLTGYTPIDGVDLTQLTAGTGTPSSTTIAQIANNLLSAEDAEGHLTPAVTITDGTLAENGTYTANVSAGVYVAIINKSEDGTVYNPILLTAAYAPEADEENEIEAGQLIGGSISTGDYYLHGATAVAKSTSPDIKKEITGGTTQDSTIPEGTDTDNEKRTASIGDKIDFKLTPTVPSYPKEAINKTFFISDTMDTGLTFDYSTLTVAVEEKDVTKSEPVDGVTDFVMDGKVIAKATETENGFNVAFQYENLVINDEGGLYVPTVTYSAIVNDQATIGKEGNENEAYLYYANQCNQGKEYDNPKEKPDPQKDEHISEKHDEKVVYTYRLAFLKTDDSETNPAPLAGAIFGIYDDEDNLVDVVTTNASGYAESTNVKAGTYTIKELAAPDGYSLTEETVNITVTWATATKIVNGTTTKCEYTSVAEESLDGVQVGWLKGNQFYAMDEFTEEGNGVLKAYVKQTSTTTTSITTVEKNEDGEYTEENGTGVSVLPGSITNTKLISLPSTGGIGTTIFTIGGCAIMIIAAGLFFATRRKSEK